MKPWPVKSRVRTNMSKSVEIQEAEFDQAVLQSKIPVLVDFWAPRCIPCRSVTPIVDELVNQYEGEIFFVELNVDDNPGIASRYGVMGLPTLIIFNNGKPVSSIVGFTKETRSGLTENIKSILGLSG